MGKSIKPNVTKESKRAHKKMVSHGSYRAVRKPNSPAVKTQR